MNMRYIGLVALVGMGFASAGCTTLLESPNAGLLRQMEQQRAEYRATSQAAHIRQQQLLAQGAMSKEDRLEVAIARALIDIEVNRKIAEKEAEMP